MPDIVEIISAAVTNPTNNKNHIQTQNHYDQSRRLSIDYSLSYDYEEMEETEEIVEEVDEMTLLNMIELENGGDSLQFVRSIFVNRDASYYGSVEETALSLDLNLHFLPCRVPYDLFHEGFAIIDDILNMDHVESARNIALSICDTNLVPASLYRMDDDPFRDRLARDDRIAFLHPDQYPATHESLSYLLKSLKSIQSELSTIVMLNGESEFQLAIYEGHGGRYEVVTCIFHS